MDIKLYSKGAAQEVTGSRHYLEFEGKTLQIDCGAFQGKRKESEAKNRAIKNDIKDIDALVLTHAHFDHCGMLPLLTKNGYRGNIYSTPATRDLSTLIMMDSAHIQARDIEFLSKKAMKNNEEFSAEPLYTEDDVITAQSQFVTLSYNRPLFVLPEVELKFYDAGHILGSAIAYLTLSGQEGEKTEIAFSGDLGRKNKAIIRDPEIIPTPDYLILESTYGNRLHEGVDEAFEKLGEVVNSTIKKHGKIIIPAFAIERTQELVYYLHLLTDKKVIPEVPIYVDSPMATNATAIFRVHQECYDKETNEAFIQHHENPFGFNSLKYTTSVAESKSLNDIKGPAIIISADGMCENGRIRHHLIRHIDNPANTILIVGYMASHTLGRRILEKQKEVRIFNEWKKLNARVETINAFSAHADYSEIREYVSNLDLNKLKKIFLVHGEPEAQKNLKKVLLELGVKDVETVKYGESYMLTT